MPELYVRNWISEHLLCVWRLQGTSHRSALWHVTCVGHTPVLGPEGPSAGFLLLLQQRSVSISRGLGVMWLHFTPPGVTCSR